MGLVNRVVPAGTARKAAEQLAREIAGLPQACLRSDRASALDGAVADATTRRWPASSGTGWPRWATRP